MKGDVILSKSASYGIRMLGVGNAFMSPPDMPEYKYLVSVKEFSEKSGINIDDINKLIEIENDDRRGFRKDKALEKVLFKVIDYRTAILKKGYFCKEVEDFLYPPKAIKENQEEII